MPSFFSFAALLILAVFPFVVAADGLPGGAGWKLVPDCEDVVPGTTTKECGFKTLVHLIKHLIDFVIFLAMPIAALVSVYAGWFYLTAGENPGNVSVAKKMFWALFIGVAWVLGAWLVIKFISDALLHPEFIAL